MIRRLILILALLAFAPAAMAQDFPKLTGQVVDAANLLDDAQEAALTARLAELATQSGRQVVVATVPDLQGYDIGDYGYRLGRAWGIGDQNRNDGALLIVAPNERKVRIEVGYGLEGIMTDALSAQIIRNAITPRFKAGDMAGGIAAGVEQIGALLALPPEEAKARAAQAAAQAQGNDGGDGAVLAIWITLFIVFFFVLPMMSRMKGGRRYRGGGGPVILWGPGAGGSGGSSGWGSGGGSGWGGGGFSGGGGSFGGGGASGGW
ncbi:MAG: YgcG family protein [Sphingobium sp.]